MSEQANDGAARPAKSNDKQDLAGAFADFLSGLEVYAPVVQGWLEEARQLSALAEKTMPNLTALAPLTDWARRFDKLSEKSKAASKGWFFGWHDGLNSLMKLVEKLGAAQSADIDRTMVEYYRLNLQPFTDELIGKYPDRARAIRAAVNAHLAANCEGYLLSIPVFIAQADGLLTEITKVKSALMKNGKSKELQASKALREKLSGDQRSLNLLNQILMLHESDLMKSAEARQIAAQKSGESFTALNRHLIMHGKSSDYGSEINSLKAFSFLVCVAAHLPAVLDRLLANA